MPRTSDFLISGSDLEVDTAVSVDDDVSLPTSDLAHKMLATMHEPHIALIIEVAQLLNELPILNVRTASRVKDICEIAKGGYTDQYVPRFWNVEAIDDALSILDEKEETSDNFLTFAGYRKDIMHRTKTRKDNK